MDELRSVVGTLKGGLDSVAALQQEMADCMEDMARNQVDMARKQEEMARKQEEMARKQEEMARKQEETAQATVDLKRHFDTFLVRFEEALEMLVQHDTDQLRRVTAVERDNADLRARVEAIERRLAS